MNLNRLRSSVSFYLLKTLFPQALSQAQALVLVPLESLATIEKADSRHSGHKSSLRLIHIDLADLSPHALLLVKLHQTEIVENPIWLPLEKNNKTPTQSEQNAPYTPEQVINIFAEHGVTITDFCLEHGLSRMSVVDLLRGHGQGLRGDSHRAAVILGLKPDPRTKHINHPFQNQRKAA